MKHLWLVIIYILTGLNSFADLQTVCYGEDFVLQHENTTLLLSQLQTYFTNCEYVYDNLEIVFTQMTVIPAEFSNIFSSIQEIRGYLHLENIEANTMTFPELVIIRGTNSLDVNNVSNALVLKNTKINSIIFPKLREITEHGVTVYNTEPNISTACNLNGVSWDDILKASQTYNNNSTSNCPATNCAGCPSGFCWDSNNCQVLTQVPCASCVDRCLPNSSSCCDTSCSAGCEGTVSDCVSCANCRNFILTSTPCSCANLNDGNPKIITSFTTPPKISPPNTCLSPLIEETVNTLEFCRRECEDGMCVEGVSTNMLRCRSCGVNEDECTQPFTLEDNEINPTLITPIIPKTASCPGIVSYSSIRLTEDSFDPTSPITPVYLEVFDQLTEINDYLVIQGFPSFYGEVFSSLSQLTIIKGESLFMDQYALYIKNNSFREIDLRSLDTITQGSILIENNPELCYLPNVTGFQSLRSGIQVTIQGQDTSCPCHNSCEQSQGCWGPFNTQCISCVVVEVNDTCVDTCESQPNTYIDVPSRTCAECDSQCINCTGTPSNCTQCRNVSFEGQCRAVCPITHYKDNGQCLACNSNCKTNGVVGSICSGPSNMFGLAYNGCNECNLYLFQATNGSVSNYTCVDVCVGSYEAITTDPSPQCNDCNQACTECSGARVEDCDRDTCTRFFQENDQQCTLTCSNSTQYSPTNSTCSNCDDNCIGCVGDTSEDCIECRNLRRGTDCVSSCRTNEYLTNSSECELCNEDLCSTCSVTRDNCTSCSRAALNRNGTVICLSACPSGYYRAENIFCQTCNRECFNCTGGLDSLCNGACKNFNLLPAGRCVSECPSEAVVNNATKTCTVFSTFLQPGAIAGLSVAAVLFVAIVGGVIAAIVIGTVCSRRYKKKIVEKERIEGGPLLAMKEKGKVKRTIQGLPEFTLLGYNYEILNDATPFGFQVTRMERSSLELRERMGKGLHGYVYASLYTQGIGEVFPVAVKTFYEAGLKRNYKTEFEHVIRNLSKIPHTSLIKVFGYNSEKPDPFIVTQLLIGPSLYTIFAKYAGSISEEKIFNFTTQLVDAMYYLENHKLVHGLLTARSILLANQDEIKLTDCFSYKFSDAMVDNAPELPIPDRWMSPELALNRTPTHKSDIWGYGVVFWEMLSSAELPYNRVADDDIIDMLQQGQRLTQPKACTVDLYGYLLQCFIFEPTGRPTFERLQTDLLEMAKNPLKYIFIDQDEQSNVTTLAMSRIASAAGSKESTLIFDNPGARPVGTLTNEDLPPDELGLGEYVDEEVVEKNIEILAQPLINDEYSEINEGKLNESFKNEYNELDETKLIPAVQSVSPESQPLFTSYAPNTTPLSSFDVPTMISPKNSVSPYELPVETPNSSIFSPYCEPGDLFSESKSSANNEL